MSRGKKQDLTPSEFKRVRTGAKLFPKTFSNNGNEDACFINCNLNFSLFYYIIHLPTHMQKNLSVHIIKYGD